MRGGGAGLRGECKQHAHGVARQGTGGLRDEEGDRDVCPAPPCVFEQYRYRDRYRYRYRDRYRHRYRYRYPVAKHDRGTVGTHDHTEVL